MQKIDSTGQKFNAQFDQYKKDIFQKLNFNFQKGKTLLDVGCGDCTDAEIFLNKYKLNTYGIDIYKHKNIKSLPRLVFKKAGIYKIPYPNNTFDYVFLHDILHHIDEKNISYTRHVQGLNELKRVCKKGGKIIIIEGNRYNPLFYPHMVKMMGHDHFRQSYFKKIIKDVFPNINFKYFEAHAYPPMFLNFFKIYETIMERIPFLRPFIAYNVAVITNE